MQLYQAMIVFELHITITWALIIPYFHKCITPAHQIISVISAAFEFYPRIVTAALFLLDNKSPVCLYVLH